MPSNRVGEALFSLTKRLLDRNKNTRAEVMDIIAKVRGTKTHATQLIMKYFSIEVRKRARHYLLGAKKRIEYYKSAHELIVKEKETLIKEKGRVNDIILLLHEKGVCVDGAPTVHQMQSVLAQAKLNGTIDSVGISRVDVEKNIRLFMGQHSAE